MDVAGRTALAEMQRTPLYELQKKPVGDFREECELLIEASNFPVVMESSNPPANFTEQDPTPLIALVNTRSWALIPPHRPYESLVYSYSHYSGPAGFPAPNGEMNINGKLYQAPDGDGLFTIFPHRPRGSTTVAPRTQDNVRQFSMWKYDPCQFFNQNTFVNYFDNYLYINRCRWRANQTVSGFIANATIYSAFNSTDFTRWEIFPYGGDQSGSVPAHMIVAASSVAPFTLPANTWLELPGPAAPSPGQFADRNNGIVGHVWFAVHSESQTDWSTRTGVPFV